MMRNRLAARIKALSLKVCVIGQGYVGLPLAVEFAKGGLCVTGVDLDPDKCKSINAGKSYVQDVSDEVLSDLVKAGCLSATTDYAALDEADAVIICVPTPLGKSKDPDISYVVAAADALSAHMHTGMLVVLESTTYPGTTEEVLLPRIRQNGYVVGQDIFVAFSPERVDPGNKCFSTRNTPKVMGGVTEACTEIASALYSVAVDTVVPVSSPATAEMCKILENTFRAVNIGLVNEMAQICHRMDIDIWEVIRAASTKPFGFMPFYPGPGLGGHCIPIDPLYLTWKMRGLGMQTRFIELADTINSSMPAYVVSRMQDALNDKGLPFKGSRILILGVAYKADIDDLRESPAIEIISRLLERGAQVVYNDPWVEELRLADRVLNSEPITEEFLADVDMVLIHTAHGAYDWTMVADHASLVLDTRSVGIEGSNVVLL